MPSKFDWDREARDRRAREQGTTPASRETKVKSYPRPSEPPRELFKQGNRKQRRSQTADPAADHAIEIDGQGFKRVQMSEESARQRALRVAREKRKKRR